MHRAMHGYDLHRQYETHLGRVWKLSQSQTYAVLKRLNAGGLIENLSGEESPGARRVFAVTPLGVRRFSVWLMHPSDCSARVLRMEFIARLFFAGMQEDPGVVSVIIEDQIAAVERSLASHERVLGGIPSEDVFNRLSMDFRVSQLRSSLAWLRGRVEPLAGPRAP